MLGLKLFQTVVFTFVITSNSMAAETSVELDDGTILSGVSTIEKQLSDSALTVLGITAGTSKLSDVTAKLQGNAVFHEGDAGGSLYLLCYRGPDGTILTFESSGEMGGPDHVVTNVSILDRKGRYRFAQKCAASSKVTQNTEVGGIRLGKAKDKVKKTMGKPSKEQVDIVLYSYHASKQTDRGSADITSLLQIRFVDKKVFQVSISKIESY